MCSRRLASQRPLFKTLNVMLETSAKHMNRLKRKIYIKLICIEAKKNRISQGLKQTTTSFLLSYTHFSKEASETFFLFFLFNEKYTNINCDVAKVSLNF